MKRIPSLLVAMFLTLAVSIQAENVSVQTAQTAARSFLNAKMGNIQQISLVDFAERAEFPNLYVFGNEHCFVIIAGDDAAHPVLGYSKDGRFRMEELPKEVFDWLKRYDEAITALSTTNTEHSTEVDKAWDCLLSGTSLEPKLRSNVKPLIRTKWNQSIPFNNLCPPDTANHSTGHSVAGCGAIAMAQIMNYWEHPVRGIGSHSYTPSGHPEYGTLYANFGETVYDWDNMKNFYSRGYTDVEALAVATLVYHCGVSVNMNYGPSASGVNSPIIDDAFRNYFDYSSSTDYLYKSNYNDAQWVSMLKNDLDNLQPVLYRAASNNQGANAHIFICDGYDENELFHFNWGHGGNYDGYYTIGNLHEGSVNYTYGNAAIFGCYPNTPSINPPANVTVSIDERNVTINWTTVSGAAYYKLYRDGDLVNGHITGNSFTESNVSYGLHNYYVKSVKADGTMSLKSSFSIADVLFTGPCPSNLQANVNGQNVSLSWQIHDSGSNILQYGTGQLYGTNGYANGTYWGQRYSTSTICEFAGMAIEKISAYFSFAGNYTLFIYKGDEINTNELVYQQDFNITNENWHDIVPPNPVVIDYTQDLWVVLYSSINNPAPVCVYTLPDKQDAALFSNTGVRWTPIANRSCMIKTYITDGTYTYNLYRDGNVVANDLTGNTYNDNNLPDGFYDYHVTTNYFGGESDPSNTASVMVGNPTYTISASANPTNGGTVTGAGTYNYGQTCTLSATPAAGYNFIKWTKNGTQVSTNANYSFTVTEAASYVAHFQIQSYTISASANPTNGGSVSGGGTYNYGQTCTLMATPTNGYNFVNWTENGSGVSSNATYSFTVNANRTLVANFQLDNFVVSVSADPANGGSATGGGAFHYGDNCTVTATANPGFNFVNWTENGNVVSVNESYSFTVNANHSLVAHFTSQNYVITAIADPTEAGTVTGAGGYNYGETCTLNASANAGYTYINWTRNGSVVSTNPSYSFTVTESASFVAHFSAQSFTVGVTVNPSEGGTVSGGGQYTYGQQCTVHATASPCYQFTNWTENGSVVSTSPDYTFTVTANRNLMANFTLLTYTVTVDIEPAEGGHVVGVGAYDCGESVTLEAVANENYSFVGWLENGDLVSSAPTMAFVATADRHLTARFASVDGIEENDPSTGSGPDIEVYPNPANDVVYIEGKGIKKVTVFNALGQVVERLVVNKPNAIQLKIDLYDSGAYLIQIETMERMTVRQIIKE